MDEVSGPDRSRAAGLHRRDLDKTNMSPLRGGGKLDSSRSILSMQFAPRATASMHEIVKDAADADIKALADWVGAQQ
ncbi:MAG: hypothetical protein EOS48_23900 [Mesorhizobium sp.]|nr:MAG: hypothetical protein EOS48_23900 [Mesorhizobium sp.]